jgi:hypothetical protein
MKHPFHFLVSIPEAGLSLTWIGGGLKPSKSPGKLWLTTPDGRPVLEVDKRHVQPSTLEQTAQRIIEDRRAAKARLNKT